MQSRSLVALQQLLPCDFRCKSLSLLGSNDCCSCGWVWACVYSSVVAGLGRAQSQSSLFQRIFEKGLLEKLLVMVWQRPVVIYMLRLKKKMGILVFVSLRVLVNHSFPPYPCRLTQSTAVSPLDDLILSFPFLSMPAVLECCLHLYRSPSPDDDLQDQKNHRSTLPVKCQFPSHISNRKSNLQHCIELPSQTFQPIHGRRLASPSAMGPGIRVSSGVSQRFNATIWTDTCLLDLGWSRFLSHVRILMCRGGGR
jgi:hypothetical protein